MLPCLAYVRDTLPKPARRVVRPTIVGEASGMAELPLGASEALRAQLSFRHGVVDLAAHTIHVVRGFSCPPTSTVWAAMGAAEVYSRGMPLEGVGDATQVHVAHNSNVVGIGKKELTL